jgi:hypothetical protein
MVNKRDSTFDDEDSPHYQKKYFQELHDHAAAEGQKMGTEMAAYFEQEQLGESLGKIQVHNHPDKNGVQREWRSQGAFLPSFAPSFLSLVLSFFRYFFPSFLSVCLPSFLSSFLPFFLCAFIPSFVPS